MTTSMIFRRSLALFMVASMTWLSACSPPKAKASPEQQGPPPAAADAKNIVRQAADLPGPLSRTESQHVTVDLETVELNGVLADGTTYTYWTFNGTVPGPMIRVRQGDTVELRLTNSKESMNSHSIDLHAVNGPGGGGEVTQVKPGETKSFTFQALNPGVFVYHCATVHVPTHVAKGMYGLIVVEPEEGLVPVDREFYVMQGEIYSAGARGEKGHLEHDSDRQFDARPNFVVFNGRAAALTGDLAMKARVGERIRLFVGNGGPNLALNFHVIGEIFDAVHKEGAREAAHDVQTTLIPAGGAAWMEFTVDVPGRYVLVDHALTRAIDKGAVAVLEVEGPGQPQIFTH